jgi:ribosomal protein S18 acetylase RimI-like enzyme
VEVAENNGPAINLYRRMGFVTTGILKTWYDVTKIF